MSQTAKSGPDQTEVGSYFIANYPPFSVWSEEQLPQVEQALRSSPAEVPLGLYLHIPFCRKRCKFCYFRVYTDKRAADVEVYLGALEREIDLLSQTACIGQRPFRFVYFGGGTPSFLSVKQLSSLFARLRRHTQWEQAEEVTFECEPGTLSEPKVRALADLGVTRLSLGVENFDDEVLRENGRAHLSAEIERSWQWIDKVGFPHVNLDLIAGMVGDSWENWQACIARSLALQPDSVTVYQMELPFNTTYSAEIRGQQRQVPVADWPTKRAWVRHAFDVLLAAGYHPSSAYTLVRDPQRVTFSYRDNLWRGSDLLATGVASFGHVSGVHYQNHADWAGYVGALDRGQLPLSRAYRLSEQEALVREVILQLKRGELQVAYFQQKFGVDIRALWREVWRRLQDEQFAELQGERIRLTTDGLLRVDALLPRFFLPQHQGLRYT